MSAAAEYPRTYTWHEDGYEWRCVYDNEMDAKMSAQIEFFAPRIGWIEKPGSYCTERYVRDERGETTGSPHAIDTSVNSASTRTLADYGTGSNSENATAARFR